MAANIKIDVSRARSSAVGREHGILPGELRELEPAVRDAHKRLREARSSGEIGFWDLHKDRKTLQAVRRDARAVRDRGYKNLVVLGIGGSALGVTTLATALLPPYHNLRSQELRGGAPRLYVMDNVDPDTFSAMLELCDPQETVFNVISKSGGTAETVAQMMVVLETMESKLGKADVKDHVIITTGPRKHGSKANPLQYAERKYGLRRFDVPENVGGRFSVFSPVGLFPAAVLGIDIQGLAKGCAAMDKRCSTTKLRENPAYLRAAFHYLALVDKSKTSAVMLPYSDKLRDAADWYRQLWAESLGKKFNVDGDEVFVGQTPIRALGATDQHSQLQLYLEGPNDKLFTVLEEEKFRTTVDIPDTFAAVDGLDYLRGKSLNRLIASERRATVDALTEAQRPVIQVTFPEVNAETVAQLLYMLEVETAMAGQLLRVNAFDQPGVEAIKVFTRNYMRESP